MKLFILCMYALKIQIQIFLPQPSRLQSIKSGNTCDVIFQVAHSKPCQDLYDNKEKAITIK